jgi:hypothetical protein
MTEKTPRCLRTGYESDRFAETGHNFLAIQFAFAKSFAKMSEIRQLP